MAMRSFSRKKLCVASTAARQISMARLPSFGVDDLIEIMR